MKLHTKLDIRGVYNSLIVTKARGLMTEDIYFHQLQEQPSRTHPHGYLIQLATYDQRSGPKNSRHYKNTGTRGSHSEYATGERLWAATYDEWGWFIAEIMRLDPTARFGQYEGPDGFNRLTKFAYIIPESKLRPGTWHNELHP